MEIIIRKALPEDSCIIYELNKSELGYVVLPESTARKQKQLI